MDPSHINIYRLIVDHRPLHRTQSYQRQTTFVESLPHRKIGLN